MDFLSRMIFFGSGEAGGGSVAGIVDPGHKTPPLTSPTVFVSAVGGGRRGILIHWFL